MSFILIVAWMTLPPQGPPEIIKTEFSSLEMCRGAQAFAMELIEQIPTQKGVKFMIQCVPANAGQPEPEKEDRGI